MQLFLKRPWKVLFETVVPLATLGSSEMPNSMPLYIFCSCAFMVLPVTTAFPPTLRESAVRTVGSIVLLVKVKLPSVVTVNALPVSVVPT